MNNNFYIPPTKPDEIFHYGVPERSGRYKWGSGDRPYQRLEGSDRKAARKEAKRQKNLKIGKERLTNRIAKANTEADRLSRKIGWGNTEQAGKQFKRMENIRDVSNSILGDEERTIELGNYTRKVRNVIVGATAIGAIATGGTSMALAGAFTGDSLAALMATVVATSAVAIKGRQQYQKTKY